MPGGGGGRPSSDGWAAAICGSITATVTATATAIVTAAVVVLAVTVATWATRPVTERNLMGILLTLPPNGPARLSGCFWCFKPDCDAPAAAGRANVRKRYQP